MMIVIAAIYAYRMYVSISSEYVGKLSLEIPYLKLVLVLVCQLRLEHSACDR